MTPLGPRGFGPPQRQRSGAIVALSIATLIIVPWVIIDTIRGDDPPATTTTTTTVASSTTTTTTTAPESSSDEQTYQQVTLAASWMPRGTSRYSETDDQTMSRVRRQKIGETVAAPTTTTIAGDVATTVPTKQTTEAPSTTAPGSSAKTPTTVPATQAPATQPRPTQPPATDPPATSPPPTEAPATTAPPVDPAPAPAAAMQG